MFQEQTFLNMLFWKKIQEAGGSITFTEEDLRSIKSSDVGCIKVEYGEDNSVTLEAVDRDTLEAYVSSIGTEKH